MSSNTITAEQAMNENAKEENENTADFLIFVTCNDCNEKDAFCHDSLDYGLDSEDLWIVGTDLTQELHDSCECGANEFLITAIHYRGKIVNGEI